MSIMLGNSGRVLTVAGGVAIDPACCCCCPTATLRCDQISAIGYKCGFNEFDPSSPPKIYRYATETFSETHTETYCDATFDYGSVYYYDNSDPNNCVFAGAMSCFGSKTISRFDPFPACEGTWEFTGPPCMFPNDCGCGLCIYGPFTIDSPTHETATCSSGAGSSGTNTEELSSEYTTAELIANTVAALPPYDDDFDDDCLAVHILAEDEKSYEISRFRYKFTWDTPLENDCTINWIERTLDENLHKVSDNEMSESVAAGSTESSVYEVIEPSQNFYRIVIAYPTGACCVGTNCSITDSVDCFTQGGDYRGDCLNCGPDTCS